MLEEFSLNGNVIVRRTMNAYQSPSEMHQSASQRTTKKCGILFVESEH
jgi:hypothetical protein